MSTLHKHGCETCRFLARWDTGYSEWTVTGCDLLCLKQINPDLQKRWYEPYDEKEIERVMSFGDTCASREVGNGPWFDLGDGEKCLEWASKDPVVHAGLVATGECKCEWERRYP